jgi:hypothetical protein
MVIRFRTTSKIGVGKSPGGRPTRLTVPLRRTIRSAWAKAAGDTAVTSTPCAAARLRDDLVRGIGRLRVDRHVGAERAGEGELLLADVERCDVEAHRLRVLHRQMPEPADPGDREQTRVAIPPARE